jgi:transglutaminase-like putative cysteine protease
MPCPLGESCLPFFAILPIFGLARTSVGEPTPPGNQRAALRTRSFDFTYSATVTGLKPGQIARVWVPLARSTPDQKVTVLKRTLPEGVSRVGDEPKSGNRMLFFEGKADRDGRIPLTVVYRVRRREVKAENGKRSKEDAGHIRRFLQPDSLVPITGKPLELLKGKRLPADPMRKARLLYDLVNHHLRYAKDGTGGGRGDAVWACDSKHGNCSDFHSLFISLARSQKIPAKFEIGFPLPARRDNGEIAGCHCWAFFRPEDKGWVPVDISEANKNPKMTDYFFGNLTEDRVTFSTGRDLRLVPNQAGKPVNFFIYPYVEVDGKEYPQEKIQRKFTFRDEK